MGLVRETLYISTVFYVYALMVFIFFLLLGSLKNQSQSPRLACFFKNDLLIFKTLTETLFKGPKATVLKLKMYIGIRL